MAEAERDVTSREAAAADFVFRAIEILVLSLLTIGFFAVTHLGLLHFDATDAGSWLGIAGWWGLVSLWWLVVEVKPYPHSRPNLPLLVWVGLLLGTVYVGVFLYLYSRRLWIQQYSLVYVVWLLPVLVLVHRLRVFWKHRGRISPMDKPRSTGTDAV